ncbi:MAG: rhodanese-like domain-containing protein [Flavobacteriales bacterium]|nr:rhodanese-like domain-containing protein [Flavobacteriales bacterium]
MKQLAHFSTVVLLAIFMVSCSNGQNKTGASNGIAENVNVEEFSKHIGNAQVLDVRTPQEWNEGIIEGATMANIYDQDFEAQLGKLDKEKPVAVYCKVGGRSGQAMAKMKEMGFKEIYNLKGGMDAWKGAKKPTVNP